MNKINMTFFNFKKILKLVIKIIFAVAVLVFLLVAPFTLFKRFREINLQNSFLETKVVVIET